MFFEVFVTYMCSLYCLSTMNENKFGGVSKQRNGVMRNEKQRNGKKIFIKGGDNTSFIMNRIFCK